MASAANVLICTLPLDYTAFAVAAGVRVLGGQVEVLMPSLMPHFETHTLALKRNWSFALNEQLLFSESQRFTSIWLRRTGGSSLNLSRPVEESRVYLSTIHSSYGRSLTSFISRFAGDDDCIVVNDYASKATSNSKIDQLLLAERSGFEIPPTLISNNPLHIQAFQAGSAGGIICKPLLGHAWRSDKAVRYAGTAIMPDVVTLPEEVLRIQPAIYQELIEKAYEIRAVIFGKFVYAIRIDVGDNPDAAVDWRMSMMRGIACIPMELPDDMIVRCRRLMAELGIVYGAFDFIVTPKGDYVFLEVNEGGQFLFLEEVCPDIKIVDGFCRYLMKRPICSDKERCLSLREIESTREYLQIVKQFEDYPLPDLGTTTVVSS